MTIMTNWPETRATGVREIDSTNECLRFVLEELFLSGRSCPGDTISCPRIEDVERFLVRKFSREEDLMARSAFPGLEAHRADHAGFLNRLKTMRRELVCGAYDPGAMHGLLTDWIVDHASLFDAEFGRYLASQPEKADGGKKTLATP